jgi:crotonobetainyl-CoA:carnitine CoA-transferase CaiB-like acyl-CoA transferase
MRQLLSDVRVVEIAEDVAGDYCGKVLADLGADVIKLERPRGDTLRAHPGAFAATNVNKRGAVADPSDETGRERLSQLLARADVVVETTGGGCLDDWGTTPEEVRERHPAIVVASISGFGATGPYADYRWTDLVAQTFASLLVPTTTGPVKLPANVQSCAVGHTAAVGALGAVLRSRATGVGAFVDCAAYEALAGGPNGALRHLGFEYHDRVLPPASAAPAAAAAAGGTLVPIGIFPCADGYVSMMSTLQQLPHMLDVLDDDALRAAFAEPGGFLDPKTKELLDLALYPWLVSHTRAEIMAIAQTGGWPITAVFRPEELLEVDHLHQRGFWVRVDDPSVGTVVVPGPLTRPAEGGWQLRHVAPTLGRDEREIAEELHAPTSPRVGTRVAPSDPAEPPLRGIRVLDLTTVWSGPFVTLLLADLGAEVIRLESPWVFPPSAKGYEPRPKTEVVLGSFTDNYAPPVAGLPDRPFNRHAMNNSVGRGKLSCSLDLRSPRARELFLRLVEQSDVVIENLKLGTLHSMGIWEGELLERNPRVLVVRLPPAGLAGDWSAYAGFGIQFDALSGLSALTGAYHSDFAETPWTFHMDTVTGPAGALAILAALHYRAATGRGQVVEVAQNENLLHQLGDVFVDCQLGVASERLGNRDRRFAPQGVYACAGTRWLGLSVTSDDEWAALCALMGRNDLAGDRSLADAPGRRARHEELDAAIGAWTATCDCYDLFHALQRAGIPAAPMLDPAMFVADPHVAAREWLRPLRSRDVGTHHHSGQCFRGYPLAWERGAPALGEHNEYVFKELLGLGDDDYAELVEERIAVEDYLDRDGNPV